MSPQRNVHSRTGANALHAERSEAGVAAALAQSTITTTTVASRVRERAQQMPDLIALREKDFGIWQQVTWREYWDRSELVGHALLALGIQPGDRVAVHSENRC